MRQHKLHWDGRYSLVKRLLLALIMISFITACDDSAGPEDHAGATNGTGNDTSKTGTESTTGGANGGLSAQCKSWLGEDGSTCAGEDACAWLKTHDQEVVEWTIQFEDDMALADKADCAEAYLASVGIEANIVEAWFTVNESLSAVDRLCRSVMIGRCEPRALDQCDGLGEDACADLPLCLPKRGVYLAQEANCVEPDRFVMCLPLGHPACGTEQIARRIADASCWWFQDSCWLPEEGWELDYDIACPSREEFSQLPECTSSEEFVGPFGLR